MGDSSDVLHHLVLKTTDWYAINYLYLEVHYQGPSEEDFDSGLSDDLDFEKLEKKIDPHVIESIKKILNKYKIHAENDALVYSYFYKISLFEFKKYFQKFQKTYSFGKIFPKLLINYEKMYIIYIKRRNL